VDVEGPCRSAIYFEQIGGWRKCVLEPAIFDRRMTTASGDASTCGDAGGAEQAKLRKRILVVRSEHGTPK